MTKYTRGFFCLCVLSYMVDHTLQVAMTLPEVDIGMTHLIFNHFKSDVQVRTILGSAVASSTGGSTWQVDNYVTICGNGARGQNPVVLRYMPDGTWSPLNIDPIHEETAVYVISTPRASGQGAIMQLNWKTQTGVVQLAGYTQKINTEVHFLRKKSDTGALDSPFTPLPVRLSTGNISSIAMINYV